MYNNFRLNSCLYKFRVKRAININLNNNYVIGFTNLLFPTTQFDYTILSHPLMVLLNNHNAIEC